MNPANGPAPHRQLLTGWGRTSPSAALVVTPRHRSAVVNLLGSPCPASATAATAGNYHVVARGLGRSYGDAAQCGGGRVIDTSGLGWIGPVGANGQVAVGGGARLGDLVRRSLPLGWFLPVTPGTEHVTVGGAVAADVHGKNHHVDGSFCRYVTELTLATPTGEHQVTPVSDPDLFWATAGAMGLTGVVTQAVIQLIPVETSWVTVDTARFTDVDDLMAAMTSTDRSHRYSVAWIDCARTRRGLGRSVLTQGDHTPAGALPRARRSEPLAIARRTTLPVPGTPPVGLLNRTTIALFNEAWFRLAPRQPHQGLHTLHRFFYPLDGMSGWNRLYGPRGFVQYQFVVDHAHAGTVPHVVEQIAQSGVPAMLGVLKRFGAGNPGPLSFPGPGWTLALDFPVGPPALPPLLDRLDHLVASAGGRVYLAKDARLDPDLVSTMYPRLGQLAAVCRRVDPEGILASDLSRRLGLTETRTM